MKTPFTLGIGIAAIVASVVIVTRYLVVTTPPAPLYISHSSRPTAIASPSMTPIATLTPSVSASQGPTATLTPAPTIIPGARPTDWKTYKNYEWRFEIKIPPNWTVDDKYGIVISGDGSAIRIDNEGLGGGINTVYTTSTRLIAGHEVEVAEGGGGYFFLLPAHGEFPNYYFRISNWTPTLDKMLSTFKSW